MPRLPGITHAQAVRVFSKLGYRIAREGKHTIMSNGKVRLTFPDTPQSTHLQWAQLLVTLD
jgi:hypothetical protein